MRHILLTLAIVTGLTSTALADRVVLKDGTERVGTILDISPDTVRMRINSDGMTATVTFAADDIIKIEKGAGAAATAPKKAGVTTAPSTTPPSTNTPAKTSTANATSMPSTNGVNAKAGMDFLALQPHRGFVTDFLFSAAGWGPGSVQSLPPQLQKLWGQAVQSDAANKKVETLEAQRSLVDAFSQVDGGTDFLEALGKRERQEPFSTWMARTHWAVAQTTYRNGNLDLKDIADIERPALIGLLKEQAVTALEPLKTYFPPVDEKTGKQGPFRPSQLSGITAENALDVRDKALLARSILLVEMKLVPASDKALVGNQLTNVNHIVSRTSDLEPAAKAAAAKKK